MAPKPAPTDTEVRALGDSVSPHTSWGGFWRVLCWGGTAAVAITAVVLVGQTPIGAERLHLAFEQAGEPNQPQAVAALPARVIVDEAATRRLADAVRTLTADRERLNARIASLERNFDDMTGSIKTVLQANAAMQNAKEPSKEASKEPVKQPAKENIAALAVSPPVMSAPPAVVPPAPSPAASVPPPAPPPQAQMTEQQPQEYVPLPPLPPMRVASAPAVEPAAEPQAPAKLEYGIDLGVAVSVEAIRGEWTKVKANYGPLLTGLRPIAAPRQHTTGITDYRLVVGPFPTTAAAARLCAKFNAARVACRTAKFTGEDVAQK